MADGASGSADKSVQVKLVLLGMFWSSPSRRLRAAAHFSLILCPSSGEAAVGKSSVVLRFVGICCIDIDPASKLFAQGFQRVSTQQRADNWRCFPDSEMSP